jgi:hypothetical protein
MSFFTKTQDRRAEQVLSGTWCQWKRGSCKEREKKAECSGTFMYSGMKMEK